MSFNCIRSSPAGEQPGPRGRDRRPLLEARRVNVVTPFIARALLWSRRDDDMRGFTSPSRSVILLSCYDADDQLREGGRDGQKGGSIRLLMKQITTNERHAITPTERSRRAARLTRQAAVCLMFTLKPMLRRKCATACSGIRPPVAEQKAALDNPHRSMVGLKCHRHVPVSPCR